MDISTLLNYVLVPLIGLLGYFLKGAHDEVRQVKAKHEMLRDDFNTLSLHMANTFVNKGELLKIEATLEKINTTMFGKLDSLGDKVDSKFENLGDKIDARIDNIANKFEERIRILSDDVYTQLRRKEDKA
jgi:hypothetical protein